MHCLPAKVGYEASEELFRSSKSIVWKQAYNRMVSQKIITIYVSIIIEITLTYFKIIY